MAVGPRVPAREILPTIEPNHPLPSRRRPGAISAMDTGFRRHDKMDEEVDGTLRDAKGRGAADAARLSVAMPEFAEGGSLWER